MKIMMNNIVVKRKYIYRANIWKRNFIKLLIPISFFGSILGFMIGEDTSESVALLLGAFFLMFIEVLKNISIAIMLRFKNMAYLIEPRDYEITDELITIKFSHNITATLPNDKKLKVIRKRKYYILKFKTDKFFLPLELYADGVFILPFEVFANEDEQKDFESLYLKKK